MTDYASRKFILIADDQAFIRSLLVSMLRELGYRTFDASDGTQAMQLLARRPHAAILDHRMAGQTGLEILQAVRCGNTKAARDLPVLLLTGHADEHIVQAAGELDVSALLTKPVSKAQMKARLDSATKARIDLKSAGSYANVDVEPAECAASPRSTSNAWILRETMTPRDAPFVTAAQLAQRKGAQAHTKQGTDIHYSRLKPGMILAQDLVSAGGKLLLAAGYEIDNDMAKRLARVCEDNPNMTFLSVAPSKRKNGHAR